MKPPKNKTKRFKYKFVTPEDVESFRAKPESDLLKMHLFETQAITIVKGELRDNGKISSLKKEIKEHESKDERLTEAKNDLKTERDRLKVELEEQYDDKKEETAIYRDRIKHHQEKIQAVTEILDERKRS